MAELLKLPFSDTEYRVRVERAREEMARQGLDLLIVSVPESQFYLTGFQTGTAYAFLALLLPRAGEAVWIVRRTELSNVRVLAERSWAKEAVGIDDSDDPVRVMADQIRKRGYDSKAIGVERRNYFFTIDHYVRLQAELPRADWRDGSPVVLGLRAVKSPAELGYMRKAGAITSAAVKDALATLKPGILDRELAATLISAAIRHGSEPMSCGPFITTGLRTFLAHSSWADIPIQTGDLINTEIATVSARYNVPIFRCSVMGKPSDDLQRFHDASRAGLMAGLSRFGPGMTFDEADRVVREEVARHGYGEYFVVRAAYGIGLGFPPAWSESNVANIRGGDPRKLEAGMCFHLVPALYKRDLGCVCCSMPIEITANGCAPLATVEPELLRY
jgi:Xaa-Pro dipeptidase